MNRKIIQISVSMTPETRESYYDELVVAVCNDGSAWRLNNKGNAWEELPPIPQDETSQATNK